METKGRRKVSQNVNQICLPSHCKMQQQNSENSTMEQSYPDINNHKELHQKGCVDETIAQQR